MRGKAGVEPLTPETLSRLGRVLARHIAAGELGQAGDAQGHRVLMGHDGRESGETLAAALTKGLNAGGVHVDILGLSPTPSLAYLTAVGPYAAGIMVSASHNPAEDNGVKLFGPNGRKLNDETEEAMEEELKAEFTPPEASHPGECRRTNRMLGDYVAWLRNDAFPELNLKGWKVAMDCANGAYSKLGPRILKAFGAEAFPVNDHPDGRNINFECGALYPQVAAQAAQDFGCQCGLSVDGDGDRGLLADGQGRILDGDALLAGLGRDLAAEDRLPGRTVVATVMSNLALELWLQATDVRLLRVPVGDRYVAAEMREKGFHLGGEKSGHLLFGPTHGFRGDGMYTFLRVAEMLTRNEQSAEQFAAGYQDLPQHLENLPVARRVPMDQLPGLQKAAAEIEAKLGNQGRVVIRFSGTELKLRLMVEAATESQVHQAIEHLRQGADGDGILI